MAKKVSYCEFKKRFSTAHSNCNFEIIGYTAITKPVEILCKNCGKKKFYKNGNRAITGYSCCETKIKKIDHIKQWLNDSNDFVYISHNGDYVIVKHLKCGNTYKKDIGKFFSSPTSCKFCKTKEEKLTNNIVDAQAILDELFFGQIQLLNYKGRHEKATYRCLKCNQIFTQKFDCLLGSSGCPKCDKKQSQGEKKFKHLLIKNNIYFREQVKVDDLPRQSFDFCVYKDADCTTPEYFVEIQGEQHFMPVKYWGGEETYKKILARDNKKREYCKSHNIFLYEIVYKNKRFLNLDILPFSSTTISVKESTA